MNENTKKAWSSKASELTPEQLEKRKSINKKVAKFGCLPILILIAVIFIYSNTKEKVPDAPKTRTQLIQQQFSKYDGSHYNSEAWIQKAMNDPDSYEHVSTEYTDRDGVLYVKTTFRGKNGFGALILNSKTCIVDPETGAFLAWLE